MFDLFRVGTLLYGYCEGYFGDNYNDKLIEAVGRDWLVVRDVDTGEVLFADTGFTRLAEYLQPPVE